MNKNDLLKRLGNGIVLGAEGYLFELERRGYLQAGPFVPEVVLEYPDALRELHREFLFAGAEVMVAMTYYAHREKMGAVGRSPDLEELNRTAVRIAAEIAGEGDALTAGNLSNTWKYDPADHKESERIIRPMFEEQVQWASEEGVDFFIAETFDCLGEAKISLEVIREAGYPALVTFIPKNEESVDGYPWDEACRILHDEGADIVGLNCGRGPNTMLPILEKIREKVSGYVAAQPVPYRTTAEQPTFMKLQEPGAPCAFPLGLDPFLPTRFEMADFARKAASLGINYIGLCCGAAPHYIREIAEVLGRNVPASRYSPNIAEHPFLGTGKTHCDPEPE